MHEVLGDGQEQGKDGQARVPLLRPGRQVGRRRGQQQQVLQ